MFFMVFLWVLLIGVCGCAERSRAMKKTERMMAYIRNKYPDDSFSFLRISGGHPGSSDTKIQVKSGKYPGGTVRVILVEADGKEYFYDTYLGVKFEEETRNRLREILTASYGEDICLFYVPDDLACTENGSDRTAFEEYAASWSSHISFTAAVRLPPDFSREKETEALKEMFSGMALKGRICYFAPETIIREKGEKEMLRMIQEEEYSAAVDFLKKSPDELQKTEWRE